MKQEKKGNRSLDPVTQQLSSKSQQKDGTIFMKQQNFLDSQGLNSPAHILIELNFRLGNTMFLFSVMEMYVYKKINKQAEWGPLQLQVDLYKIYRASWSQIHKCSVLCVELST